MSKLDFGIKRHYQDRKFIKMRLSQDDRNFW